MPTEQTYSFGVPLYYLYIHFYTPSGVSFKGQHRRGWCVLGDPVAFRCDGISTQRSRRPASGHIRP